VASPIEMTIANIGNGALMEAVSKEFRKICDNIADPGVKTEAKRKLQITIVIKPNSKGQMAQIDFSAKSTMPEPDAFRTMAHIATTPESNGIALFEVETHQSLFEEELPLMPLAVSKRA